MSQGSPPVTYNPLDPEFLRDPYPHYAALRHHAPVAWVPALKSFAVSRYDDVVAVLSDPATFSSAEFWPTVFGEYDPVPESLPMLSLDPPAHLRIRKLANKAFIPRTLHQLEDKIYRVAHELVDDIVERHGMTGVVDLVPEFNALFPISVIADSLGVDVARRVDLKRWVSDLLAAGNRAALAEDRLAELAKSSDEVRAYLSDLYDRKSADPADDLISSIIAAEVDGERLSKIEVMAMAMVLLVGGVETVANLLGSTFVELRSHPDALRRVREDPKRIPALLDEVMRYNTPVQTIMRNTTRDTEIASVPVPKGSVVFALLGSANRDVAHFPDPDVFDIDRKAEKLMSFGHGPHFCIGSHLARMEAKIALDVLLERFPTLDFPDAETEWIQSFIVRGPLSVPVSFAAH